MHFVYILISLKDNNFYTGRTDELDRRIKEHERGKVVSTKNRRPLKLLCYEGYIDKEIAIKREEFLKTSDGKNDLNRRFGKYKNK